MDISLVTDPEVTNDKYAISFANLPEGGYMFTVYATEGSFLHVFLWIDAAHNIEYQTNIHTINIVSISKSGSILNITFTTDIRYNVRLKLLSLRKI
jgi:hypothetical protein